MDEKYDREEIENEREEINRKTNKGDKESGEKININIGPMGRKGIDRHIIEEEELEKGSKREGSSNVKNMECEI